MRGWEYAKRREKQRGKGGKRKKGEERERELQSTNLGQ
jgi:hypothetical protein